MLDQGTFASPFSEYLAQPDSAGARSRLYVIADGSIPAGLQSAAATSGLDCVGLSPSALLAGTALSGGMVWAVVTDICAEWFDDLRNRCRDEALSLILHASIDTLDAVIAAADDMDDCTIVVAPTETDMLAVLASQMRQSTGAVHAPVDTVRERQIESLQSEVERIGRMLARLAMDPTIQREPPSPFIDDHVSAAARRYHAGPGSSYDGPTVSAQEVRQVIRQRRLRDELFDSELFADPAWDMLLDLYAAKLDRARVSVSSLCIAAAVPATTALRWIKSLTDSGLFERKADQHDARRIFVTLSDDATQAMHRYFARLSDPRLAV